MSIAQLDEMINSALQQVGAEPINATNFDEMKDDVSHFLILKVGALTQEAEVFRVRLMYEIANAAFTNGEKETNEKNIQAVESYLTFFDASDSTDPVDRAYNRTHIVPSLLDKASKFLADLLRSYDAKRKSRVDTIIDGILERLSGNRNGMYAKILAQITEESVDGVARKVEARRVEEEKSKPFTQKVYEFLTG
jgi:hypothetical protein